MIHKMFSIFDAKVKVYNVPFYGRHSGEAIRSVQNLLSDENTSCAKYPEDFYLYEIGSYDDETGVLTTLDAPMIVTKCIDLM